MVYSIVRGLSDSEGLEGLLVMFPTQVQCTIRCWAVLEQACAGVVVMVSSLLVFVIVRASLLVPTVVRVSLLVLWNRSLLQVNSHDGGSPLGNCTELVPWQQYLLLQVLQWLCSCLYSPLHAAARCGLVSVLSWHVGRAP